MTMSKSCLLCRRNDDYQVEIRPLGEVNHLCHSFDPLSNNMYACRHFETKFDFTTGLDSPMAHCDIMMQSHQMLSYFFYKSIITQPNKNGGKNMESLCNKSMTNLKSFLDEQIKKTDHYRPTRSGMSAYQMRMHLLRIAKSIKEIQ